MRAQKFDRREAPPCDPMLALLMGYSRPPIVIGDDQRDDRDDDRETDRELSHR